MKRLANVLRQIGKSTQVFESPDGTRALILPYGGRVLGLFGSDCEHNFYWTHPALNSVKSARDFYAGNHWHNSGGDRTWLAPEVDLFFPGFPELGKYSQQRSLDPGRYRLKKTKAGLELTNEFTINLSRSGKALSLKLVKQIGPAKTPLRHAHNLGLKNITYAGYTQHTSLEISKTSFRTRDHVGIWNLIQMPHGGDLLIPTFSRTQPRQIFSSAGAISGRDLITTDHLICFRMCQDGENKISVRAATVCGRVGYAYSNGDQMVLVIRNFTVNPSGEYVDVPWTETKDSGYAVQACNVNSSLGAFSELEYHVPAIGRNMGCMRSSDTSQVWAFRGSKSQVDLVIKTLLTPYPWIKEKSTGAESH